MMNCAAGHKSHQNLPTDCPDEPENEVRIISFRKATKRESQIYFDEIQN